MSEPSNSEIMEELGSMRASFDVRLNDIYEQVKKTNGRVTKLERWKEKLDIIADYTKENHKGETVVDWQKILMYTLGLVASLIALLSYLVKK